MANGTPSVCVPDPNLQTCIAPYHDPGVVLGAETGGPVNPPSSAADIDGGAMDGFIYAAETNSGAWTAGTCADPTQPKCNLDTMGYHDSREVPNYWAYAQTYVLQDHMFAAQTSYGGPAHLFLVSGWAAKCGNDDPNSCKPSVNQPVTGAATYAWTDITYLLNQAGVSWGYYIIPPPSGPAPCGEALPHAYTPPMWNPLPCFTTVQDDNQVGNIQSIYDFYTQAANGTLPAVSWLAPNYVNADHQGSTIRYPQGWATKLITAVMQGPNWASSAIFVTWSDWGGYYDHEPPPAVDGAGYGVRVPGFMVSPYAQPGYIDHQVLSSDAYLKFIEDVFLGGQRLDPATDGRPDPRPTVRENVPILGDLMSEFNFTQAPLPQLILNPYPH
jgi:phospholipase C